MTRDLGLVTGPTGQVVSVDLDAKTIDIARSETSQLGQSNVSFEVADIRTWEPSERFNVVYSRFLLSHLAEPQAVVHVARKHIQPGGVILLEDVDFRGHFAEPECLPLRRFVEWYTTAAEKRGNDPHIGSRLPELLWKAGLVDVQVKLFHPVALDGGITLLTCVTLENIAETVLEDGLTDEVEFQETVHDLNAFANDPRTVLGGPRIFQAWGRAGT